MAGGYLPYGLAPSGELTAYTPTLRERASDWLRQKLFTDDRAGQDKANRLMDVASVTPFGFAMDAYDAGRAGGRGDYLTAGTIAAMSALPGPAPERKGIRAFHASPHSFDRFDMSKIGTGEGAQAYGHGLYFAEGENVAEEYRKFFANRDGSGYANAHMNAQNLVNKLGGDAEYAGEVLKEQLASLDPSDANYSRVKDTLDMVVSGKYASPLPPGAHMYEVNINADPNTFLDWDKPLSEQPEVQSRLASIGEASKSSTTTGMEKVTRLGDILGDRAAVTAKLREAGIPGIKYLDAGSRGAGDGTRNYVVFDDRLVSIVRKYGIAGASAMLGYNILNGMDDAQAAELKRIENSK